MEMRLVSFSHNKIQTQWLMKPWKSGNSGLSNIAQKPHFCDTPNIFQETESHVFETHIDEKL